jgi:hypothetical protein
MMVLVMRLSIVNHETNNHHEGNNRHANSGEAALLLWDWFDTNWLHDVVDRNSLIGSISFHHC